MPFCKTFFCVISSVYSTCINKSHISSGPYQGIGSPPPTKKPSPSRSDASQTFKEHGPAVCRVITTSLLYSLARYNHRLSEISPGASSTFSNFVWDVCSNSGRLFALPAWQVRIILCPCHLQRDIHTHNILRAELFQTLESHLSISRISICNAVQKYYVDKPLRLILTGRKTKQWMDFSFRGFISRRRWWQCCSFLPNEPWLDFNQWLIGELKW